MLGAKTRAQSRSNLQEKDKMSITGDRVRARNQRVLLLRDVSVTPDSVAEAASFFLLNCAVCAFHALAGGENTCPGVEPWTLRGETRSSGVCQPTNRCMRCQCPGHYSSKCGTTYAPGICFSCLRYLPRKGKQLTGWECQKKNKQSLQVPIPLYMMVIGTRSSLCSARFS